MGFRQIIFNSGSEELLALLSLFDFEAFEESEDTIIGYIEQGLCTPSFYSDLKRLCESRGVAYKDNEVEDINWNAEWESSFKPVVVGEFCIVKATFHINVDSATHIINIDPKMAFGTGHHETTFMMIQWMEELEFKDKKVLDHGCGTGVLAILAEKCLAKEIDAIDIEQDAYSNTIENSQLNHCYNINPILGTIDNSPGGTYDIILANINRNVLLKSCCNHYSLLNQGGIACISGVLKSDKEMVINAYLEAGFSYSGIKMRGDWIAVKFIR